MDPSSAQAHVFGIRHHGPGSARRLRLALEELRPDQILVEGPPDADGLIRWVAHPEMVPPVAMLVYRPDAPEQAAFFPFAEFSPEWQALAYAAESGIPAAFMDLPQSVLLGLTTKPVPPAAEVFKAVASAAGSDDYERWWNSAVEQRSGTDGFFDAVLDMMAAMREADEAQRRAHPQDVERLRLAGLREAAMRQRIRLASQSARRVAVVCGAWHAPALAGDLSPLAESDAEQLRKLPTVETAATWAAWTYARLSGESGYGAGIASPGWYDHLWRMSAGGHGPAAMTAHWMSRVATLARREGLDVAAGHVIEAVRLAEALAAMRGLPFPALDELNEAAQSVLFGGNPEPLTLIRRELIVGKDAGSVPAGVPALPLQLDLRSEMRRLGLRQSPDAEVLRLDLRESLDLDRSRLLHRLTLLNIPYGVTQRADQSGTTQEAWGIRWPAELNLRVIDAAVWGNTVREAAIAYSTERAGSSADLADLTALMDQVVLADLPEAIGPLLAAIEERSALSFDVAPMLAALPPLADVLRYGGARRSAEIVALLRRVFDHLVARVCIGLPAACSGLADDATADMAAKLSAAQGALRLAGNADQVERWNRALGKVADRRAVAGLLAGRACWLLYESRHFDTAAVILRLERALSGAASAGDVRFAADWLDGFLRDSGLLLVHDRLLWDALDRWLLSLEPARFEAAAPLLRRTFAGFARPVREQLLGRARQHRPPGSGAPARPQFNGDAAELAHATTRLLLGLPQEGEGSHG